MWLFPVRNVVRLLCSDSETSFDDVLSVGALVPMNRPAVCCARLDDFDGTRLCSGYIVVRTGYRRRIDGSDSGYPCFAGRVSGRVRWDGCCADALACGVEAVPQVEIRRETAPAVVPLTAEKTSHVATVGPSDDGSDRPAEWLNSESDCCFMDDGVLVPERSPVVSARGAAVPTSLRTIAEVFSSAVLAGGRC